MPLEDLRAVLSAAARLAESHGDHPEWRDTLAKLEMEVKTFSDRQLPPEPSSEETKQAVHRIIRASEAGTNYLILLPPDPPELEICDRCKGKRIRGSEQQ